MDAATETLSDLAARSAARDRKAEAIIWTNTVANAGTAILPLGTSVVAFIVANTTMVVSLGYIYGFHLDRAQAGALLKQMLTAIGATWALGLFSMKLGAEVAKVAGVVTAGTTTLVACSVDAVLSGSLSYGLGYTAMIYFKNGCVLDKASMRRILREKFAEGKEKVKNARKEDAKT